ncbi:MAG: hypothetical protein ABWJ42_06755 [Sulfolobales archaeon]
MGLRLMDNMLLSLIVLAILVSVGSVLLEEANTVSSHTSNLKLETVNIVVYKITNDTTTLFIVINYGAREVFIEQLKCYSNTTRSLIYEILVDRYLDSRKSLEIFANRNLEDSFCIISGDSWVKVV